MAATNEYKLISTTAKAAYMAFQVGQEGIRDLLRLDPEEAVTALTSWDPGNSEYRSLYFVTKYGQARAFDAALLAQHVTKKPYFQLEKRYIGFPMGLIPARDDENLIAGSNSGRIAWASRKEIGVSIYTLLKTRKDEEITAAAIFKEDDWVFAIGENGLALAFKPAPPLDPKGFFLRKNFRIAGLLATDCSAPMHVLAISSLCHLYQFILPSNAKEAADKPQKVCKLEPDEQLLAVFPAVWHN
jgi:hypothetical protein